MPVTIDHQSLPQPYHHTGAHLPITHRSPLSQGTLLRSLGIEQITRPDQVRIVFPGEAGPTYGPFLRFRPAFGNGGTYYIEDRLSVVEARVLGVAPYRYRATTGCKEHEQDRAIQVFLTYVEMKAQRQLGILTPVHIEWASAMLYFLEFLDEGGMGLTAATIKGYRTHLRSLAAFFGDQKIGEYDYKRSNDYIEWRTAQPVQNRRNRDGSVRYVSRKMACEELSTLRRLWNVYEDHKQVNYHVSVHVPTVDKPDFEYLMRDALARYFWAIRGRIWNVEADRWRIARDDDPSLTGPDGDRRVLRSARALAARKSMGRLFILGVYTGGRVGSLLATSYGLRNQAHVDWRKGVINRRGPVETETSKRRPAVIMIPKVLRFVENWARRDAERGITHLIHKEDGSPYHRSFSPYRWRMLDVDAGLGMHVTAHTLRHTCAMMLKAGNVSLWTAADFLGTTTRVLEERYGTWDTETQRAAANALSSGKLIRRTPLTTWRPPAGAKKPRG